MKKPSVLVTILCLAVFSDMPNIVAAQSKPDTDKLDRYLQTLTDYDKFMGSVAVLKEGELIFNRGYGVIDEYGTVPNPETLYRVGSITKTFTSAIILKLVEEGKVRLSDTLDKYYPNIPNADQITLKQLLHHRSGLVNFTGRAEYPDYYTEEISRQDLLARFETYGTEFEPDETFRYSNTGYVLLGYIIEDVTGGTYGDALETYISEPLGLNRTRFGGEIQTEANEAVSFTWEDGWEKAPQTYMPIPHGAGAVVSTPEETARFYRSLFREDILSPAALERMTETKDGAGMGIFPIPFYDRISYGHTGGIDGFHTIAAHFPEEDLTFAIFSNGLHYVLNDITIGVLEILFGQEFEIPDLAGSEDYIKLSPAQIALYSGEYASEQVPFEISVFEQGGNIMAQATGQGAFPLDVVSKTVMKYDPAGIEIEFDGREEGRYRGFTLKQAGQQIYFLLKE